MPLAIPLPSSYRDLASQVTHPGLYLDKYPESLAPGKLSEAVQRPAVIKVAELSQSAPAGLDYPELLKRWKAVTGGDDSTLTFTGTTTGPLTLHLARASALENAGLCFHRVYGFTFLPGSGLKGLARAFAETVWLDKFETEAEKKKEWQTIEAVFGWAPDSNTLKDENGKKVRKPWMPSGAEQYREEAKDATGQAIRKARPANAGSVIFHDAWPLAWPKLVTDILNSHHPKYYSEGKPPGDWEDPVPVYFLSVEPGTAFRFAVAPRRDDEESRKLADQAREWLIGGLTQLGAGAKTASGYGDFKVEGHEAKPKDTERRKSFEATLELVTPAFLSGAVNVEQFPGDPRPKDGCDLRPSTLRGQLRWWWRTMHAGFVSVDQLRAMEAAIWGDTKAGGAVRVTVKRKGSNPSPYLYSHPRQQPSGTRYAAYGMDETSRGQRKQRFVMDSGAAWEVRVAARQPKGTAVSADEVLKEATAALWLLTRFGGVGSKSRKGFGSLDAVQQTAPAWPTGTDNCVAWAKAFRARFGVGAAALNLNDAIPASLSDTDRQLVEIDAGRIDAWTLMERIGSAYSAVAATFKHDDRKAAFGLPRKIHGPMDHPLRHQDPSSHQPPMSLDSPVWPRGTRAEKGRHTSPIHLHVGKGANGTLVVRLLGLPARFLRSRAESVEMLAQFALGFGIEFANFGPPPAAPGAPTPSAVPKAPPPQLAGPQRVEVMILEKKDRSGPNAFSVQEADKPKGMLIHGTAPTPLPAVGDTVSVYREATSNPNNPLYRWSPPAPPPPPSRGGPKRR